MNAKVRYQIFFIIVAQFLNKLIEQYHILVNHKSNE